MHILNENLRSDAQCTTPYISASVLGFRPNCTIVQSPFGRSVFVMKAGK
ncbi:hypothetical protein BH10PAT3_BH10PAT3_4390 [soil metagenome]